MTLFKRIIDKKSVLEKYDLTEHSLIQLINENKMIRNVHYKKVKDSYMFDEDLIVNLLNDKKISNLSSSISSVLDINEAVKTGMV